MKEWQLEQILYLNDVGKKKLIMPDGRSLGAVTLSEMQPKKENMFLSCLRRVFTIIVNVL